METFSKLVHFGVHSKQTRHVSGKCFSELKRIVTYLDLNWTLQTPVMSTASNRADLQSPADKRIKRSNLKGMQGVQVRVLEAIKACPNK